MLFTLFRQERAIFFTWLSFYKQAWVFCIWKALKDNRIYSCTSRFSTSRIIPNNNFGGIYTNCQRYLLIFYTIQGKATNDMPQIESWSVSVLAIPQVSVSNAKWHERETNLPRCFHISRCVATNPSFIALVTRDVSPEWNPFCCFIVSHRWFLAKSAASPPPWPSKIAKKACSGLRSKTTRLKSSISFRPPWLAWPFTRIIIFRCFVFFDILIVFSSDRASRLTI